MVIYKYPVPIIRSFFDLELPFRAKILAFQTKDVQPVIWALIDPEHTHKETRHFAIRGTGEFFDYKTTDIYVGTIQLGPYVWHLYETKA